MKNLVLGVNDAIYRTCVIVAATAIVIMATIIPWGVFSRYALGQGLGWPEPIAILLMVLFTFVGAAASYRAGAHMAVQVLSDRLPPLAQPFIILFVRLAMAAISRCNCPPETWCGNLSPTVAAPGRSSLR